jgi:hypothetical protein
MKYFALAVAAVTLSATACNAQSFGDANDAAAILGAVKVCKTVIPEGSKKQLYGEILSDAIASCLRNRQ